MNIVKGKLVPKNKFTMKYGIHAAIVAFSTLLTVLIMEY